MKTIIAGSRDITDIKIVEKAMCRALDFGIVVSEIISGGARGVDRLGEKWAKEHACTVRVFDADWDKHGKAAGVIRNQHMARYADALVAVWDGKSKGTWDMISRMRKLDKPLFIWQVRA